MPVSNSSRNREPDVWSLASSIGLVIFGPWLLLAAVGYETGGRGRLGTAPFWFIGTVVLTLLGMIWTLGVVLVVQSWLVRGKSGSPSSA
jgi:membrane protein YdbS with pleckstrin-like domain